MDAASKGRSPERRHQMTHLASAFDLRTACHAPVVVGQTRVTVQRRSVTCTACLAALEKAAAIAEYRTDPDLCRISIVRHVRRRGNEWRSL